MADTQLALLTEADNILDTCGRPRPPAKGTSAVYIKKGFVTQEIAPATVTSQQQITKEITGDTDWCMRSIMIVANPVNPLSYPPSNLPFFYLQVMLPDGTFLMSNLQDAVQIAGYGSNRYILKDELICPPGSKIQVSFQVTPGQVAQVALIIVFDGAYRYLMAGGEGRIPPVDEAAGNLPRFFSNPNQNLFAAAWQCGVADPPPAGYEDFDFTYSSLQNPTNAFPAGDPAIAVPVAGNNLTGTCQIATDASEFHCQRILIQVSEDATVTSGSILVRIRLGSGQIIFDDYFDAARYLSSTHWPIDFLIRPNDIAYADIQLVDQAGTGNMYFSFFLEGFKRRRK